MDIIDILNGTSKEILGKEDDLSKNRMNICKECPLYKQTPLGPICNPNLYINEDGVVLDRPKIGFRKGCACRLNAKTRVAHSHCIVNKW